MIQPEPVPHWYRRMAMPGDKGPDIRAIRTRLNMAAGGPYDDSVASRVRGTQLRAGLPVDGLVGPETARVLGEPADYGSIPVWWQGRPLLIGVQGEDVREMTVRLDTLPSLYFDYVVEAAVRRWESSHGYTPSGIFTEMYAVELGD